MPIFFGADRGAPKTCRSAARPFPGRLRAVLARQCHILPILLLPLMPLTAAEAETPVDLELVLAVDISRSIDQEEAELQRAGYRAALTDPAIIQAIQAGMLGRIAISYVEWAGEGSQQLVLPWTMLENAEDASAFADRLAAVPIRFAMWTAIGSAIDFSAGLFDGNGFEGTRRVIDVSGDGPNNNGPLVTEARDRAIAAGITVNGLPILNDRPSPGGFPGIANLDLYYTDCVIGGPGAFIIAAENFDAFGRAIRAKLLIEIAGGLPPEAPGYGVVRASSLRHSIAAIDVYGGNRPDCSWGERQWQRYFGSQY